MGALDFFGNAYSSIENSYYNLLNWFEEKGIPLFKLNDFLEGRGIPGFPATLAIILIIAGGIAAVLYLGQGITANVSVSLEDQLGNELRGVSLTVLDVSSGKTIFSETVSSGGIVELKNVRRGQELEFTAEKSGYENPPAQRIVVSGADMALLLTLTRTQKTSSVQFKLVDSENSTPVQGAVVTASFQGQEVPVEVAEDGTVTLNGVPIGEQVTLKVKADNYEELADTITFDGTSIPTLNLSPKGEAVTGTSTLIVTVVDKATQAQVKNARIQIYDNVSGSAISDVVNSEGYYTTEIPKGKVVRLVVNAGNYAQYDSLNEGKTLTLRADEVPWKVELEPGSVGVGISVLDNVSGSPLSGATVQLFNSLGEKVDENTTGFGGGIEFLDLNANSEYYATAALGAYLPARAKFSPASQPQVSLQLESATKSNSVTLNVFVSEASKKPASNSIVRFLEQVDENTLLPLGAQEQKTDLSGYAFAIVPVDKTIVVKATKGEQETEGSIETKAFVENELRLVFPGATGIIALNVYDLDGTPLTQGVLAITSDAGTALFEGELGEGSVFFDAKGTKWIGVTVKKVDGQTYSEKVDVSGKDQVDFKIGAKEAIGASPQISLLRTEDLEGNEVVGLTRGKEYYLVFETVWLAGEYTGGVHVRVGDDSTRFADSQGIGITGYQAEAAGEFFGRSYHPSPLPGNEGIDSQNKGRGGQHNKFVEIYFVNPGGTKIVKVRVKVKETAPEEMQQVHFRAWANASGTYYRTPADDTLSLAVYTSQKSGLYAKTTDQGIQVFESLPDCSGGICSEFRFVDSSGRQYDAKGFQAIAGKVYALEAGLLSLQKDASAEVRLQTTSQAPLIGFVGSEVGAFSQFPDNERTDTEISLGRVDLAAGAKTPMRAYFKARQAGSTFVKFIASSGGSVIAKQFYFNVAKENKMKLDYLQSTSVGQALILKIVDENTSEAITSAQIMVRDSGGKLVETIIGNNSNNKGLGGAYSFGANYEAGAFFAGISAPGYSDAIAQFVVVNDNAFQLPESITIDVLKGGQPVTSDLSLKNKLGQAITSLTFEVQKDSAWPEGMELMVQGPSTLDKRKEALLKATASYSGNAETAHGEAEVVVRGLAAGNVMVTGKTRAMIEYNRPFSSDCLELTPPELTTYLVGTQGNTKTLEITAKNNCPVFLDLAPEITSPSSAQGIRVQTSGLRIEKGKSQAVRIDVLNEIPLILGGQQRRESFSVYFKSDQLTKSVQLQVNIWDPYYALDTSEDLVIWLSSYGSQKEAVSEVPLFMHNIGPEPLYNLSVTTAATNLHGVNLVILPSYPIQVLPAGQSLIPPIILHASTKQAKSQNVRSELIIQGQVGNQLFPLRRINLWFNISAPSCVEIKTPGDPVEFISSEPALGTIDKTVTVFNHCSEAVRIAPELTPSQLDGGNELLLQPLGSDTLNANEGAEFKLTLVKKGAAKRSQISVVAHAFMLGSQNWADTQRFNVSLSLGQKELPQEMSGSAVQMQVCEKPTETKSVKFPKLALGNDCANGYCDAEQLSTMLAGKISDAVSQAKFKALAANKSAENASGCSAQKGYCTFDELGVKAQSFSAYFSNDALTPEMLSDALRKTDALKGFDASPYAGTEEALASIARSGYQNRVFLSSNLSGCAKYSLRVNGTLPVVSGEIVEAPNAFVQVLAKTQTSECQNRIENFLNFIPSDSSYSYSDRKGSWLGTVDAEQGLAEAAKTIASNLFGKPERYAQNSETNRVLVKTGEVKGIVRLSMSLTPSNGPETITATLNTAYKTATNEETRKGLADEAARAIKAFKDKATEACISPQGDYIEVKSYKEVGKLRIAGCGADEKPESTGSLVILPGIETNCALKAMSEVEQSITARQTTALEDLGGGVQGAKLKALKSQADKEFKDFAEADYLKLDFNRESKLYEKSISVNVLGKNPTAPSNGKTLKVEIASTLSSERAAKSVALRACAIHPVDLYSKLLVAPKGTYYATLNWKGSPEEFTADELGMALLKEKVLEQTKKSITTAGNSVPVGIPFEENLKGKKLEGIAAYSGGCFAACEACNAVKKGGGLGLVWGAVECGVFICGVPAAYSVGEVQGWWSSPTDLVTKPYEAAKSALGFGGTPTSLPAGTQGISPEVSPDQIYSDLSTIELVDTGIIATYLGVRDIMGRTIDKGMQETVANRLAGVITKDIKGLSKAQAEEVAKQLAPAIAEKIPVGTALTETTLKDAASTGLGKAAEKGLTITGPVAPGSAMASAVSKSEGALLDQSIKKYAQDAVYDGFKVPKPSVPKGSVTKVGPIAATGPVTVTTAPTPAPKVKVPAQVTARAKEIAENVVSGISGDATITPADKTAMTKTLTTKIKNALTARAGQDVSVDELQNFTAQALEKELNARAAVKAAVTNSLAKKAAGAAVSETGGKVLKTAESELIKKTRLTRLGEGVLNLFKSSRFWRGLLCGAAGEAGGYAGWQVYWKNSTLESKDNVNIGAPSMEGDASKQPLTFGKGQTYKFAVDDKGISVEQAKDFSSIPSDAKWLPENCTGNEWDKELKIEKAEKAQAQPASTGSTSQSQAQAQASADPRLPMSVVGASAMTAEQVDKVLGDNGSPAAGTGKTFVELGEKYGIKPEVALAFFAQESTYGKEGRAVKTKSMGNIRYFKSPKYCPANEDGFCSYPTWESGIEAWYNLIKNSPYYVAAGKTTVDEIIPVYCPPSECDVQGYVSTVKGLASNWASQASSSTA